MSCGAGESVDINGDVYCVYTGPIIETRFECPAFAPNQHVFQEMVVCSAQSDLPGGIGPWPLVEELCEDGTVAPCTQSSIVLRPASDIANDLARVIWADEPDAALLAAVADGSLSTRDGVETQVERMLADPRTRAGSADFWVQYFGLTKLEAAASGSTPFDATLADAVMTSMFSTLYELTLVTNGDTRDIFTSRSYVVETTVGNLIGVPAGPTPQVVQIPTSADRAGALSHPGFLIAHSNIETGTEAISVRGVAIAALMCNEIPPEPPDVQPVPAPVAGSQRTKLEAMTVDPACAACHTIIDEPSFALGGIDAQGAERTLDDGFPVDTSGRLSRINVAGAEELGAAVRDNPATMHCMTKKWLRFAVNGDVRTEVVDEENLTTFLQTRWVMNDYKLANLLKDILTSDAFLQAP